MRLNPIYYLVKLDKKLLLATDAFVLWCWNEHKLSKTGLRAYAVAIWLGIGVVQLAHSLLLLIPLLVSLCEGMSLLRERLVSKKALNNERELVRWTPWALFGRWLGVTLLVTSLPSPVTAVQMLGFTAHMWLFYALFPVNPPAKKREEARLPLFLAPVKAR